MPERRRINEGSQEAIFSSFLSSFRAALVLLLMFPAAIQAATLQMTWNPNAEPDFKGYKVFYGTAPGIYGIPIDVGNVTNYELTGMKKGTTYYIALTAYDASLNESDLSAAVSATLPPNRAPHPPGKPSPSAGATKSSLAATLAWTGGDPDLEDVVTYDIYFGTDNPPPPVNAERADTAYPPGTLRPSTTYFWQVVNRDNQGMETVGPVWSFTTVGRDALFPTASLILNQTTLRHGDLLRLDLHLTTPTDMPPSGGYPIELKLWLRTPMDPPVDWISLIDLAGPENHLALPPGVDQAFPIISTPLPPDVPPGLYEFGIRLRNPITNQELSVDTQPFNVVGP